LEESVRILRDAGHVLRQIPTARAGHATQLAREAVAAGADLILTAGGDGTVNEVLNGMAGSSVPLGILPGGTACVLAMETGIGKNMRKAAWRIADMRPVRIAIGLLHADRRPPRHFLLMAGAGLDAEVVRRVKSSVKRRIGKGAYWLAGMSMVGERLPQMEVLMNENRIRTGFALASRVANYGGDLSIARTATLMDNRFEVVTFEGESSLGYLKYMAGVVTGTHMRMRGVSVDHVSSLALEAAGGDRIGIQVDGEHAGYLPARLEIVPDGVTLLIP
jgi:diacylglycerol kinase (ATP)